MNEIIFRGKREDGGWEYGFLTWNKRQGYVIQNHDQYGATYTVPVDPETIGQYINATDIDGNKVYEGDICKGHHFYKPGQKHRFIGTVTFDYCARLHGVKQYKGMVVPFNGSYRCIGNVIDNPELIKEDSIGEN